VGSAMVSADGCGNALGDVARKCVTANPMEVANDLGHPFGDYFRMAGHSPTRFTFRCAYENKFWSLGIQPGIHQAALLRYAQAMDIVHEKPDRRLLILAPNKSAGGIPMRPTTRAGIIESSCT